MADPSDDMLREAAHARGFRLVKSRRRKPGGDFGRYGLVDLKTGRECLGFGDDGLTATPEEVHAYLRGGEVAAWKRSLIGVVGSDENRPAKTSAKHKGSTRSESSPAPKKEKTTPSPFLKARKGARPGKDSPPALAGGAGGGSSRSPSSAKPQPTIREATRRDAAALAKLLGTAAATLADRLAAAIRADEPPLVADRGGLIGVAGWTSVQSLHQGSHGRITLLLVAEPERRRGIGTLLLAEAEQRLREAGIEMIELALEIDFDAPTAFLRRAGFARTTNGYGKSL